MMKKKEEAGSSPLLGQLNGYKWMRQIFLLDKVPGKLDAEKRPFRKSIRFSFNLQANTNHISRWAIARMMHTRVFFTLSSLKSNFIYVYFIMKATVHNNIVLY